MSGGRARGPLVGRGGSSCPVLIVPRRRAGSGRSVSWPGGYAWLVRPAVIPGGGGAPAPPPNPTTLRSRINPPLTRHQKHRGQGTCPGSAVRLRRNRHMPPAGPHRERGPAQRCANAQSIPSPPVHQLKLMHTPSPPRVLRDPLNPAPNRGAASPGDPSIRTRPRPTSRYCDPPGLGHGPGSAVRCRASILESAPVLEPQFKTGPRKRPASQGRLIIRNGPGPGAVI